MSFGANLKAVEQAMTEIRRRQSRRSIRELADLQTWGRDDLSLLPALEAQPGILKLNSATSGVSELAQSGWLVNSTSPAAPICDVTSSSRNFLRAQPCPV